MSISDWSALENEVISILSRYSAKRSIQMDQMIGRDLGINGLDGVEIVEELQDGFAIDLSPLIKSHESFRPPRWIDKLQGKKVGPAETDFTVRELIEFIGRERGLLLKER